MNATEPATEIFGRVTITTWTDHEGISINVHTAGTRNSALSATYLHEDREEAKAWYRQIRDSALAGTAVWLIEAQVSALIDAAQAVGADAEMVASINQTMDRAATEHLAGREEARRIAADVMGNGRGWDRFADRTRTNTRPPSSEEPSPTMLRALELRNPAGEILVQTGVAASTLTAMERRGMGRCVRGGTRRYEVVKLVLNARGLDAAQQTEKAA